MRYDLEYVARSSLWLDLEVLIRTVPMIFGDKGARWSTARILSLAPLQIAQALIGFGAIAAFTRLMSAEDFGRYALALSISMAAHTLAFTWAEAAKIF